MQCQKHFTEETSRQLLYQRIRTHLIELLDMYSSLDGIAALGAYEIIELAGDLLPLHFDHAPKAFSEREIEAISKFTELAERAADATEQDTWGIDWFKSSQEWVSVSKFTNQTSAIFSEHGRFIADHEEGIAT